MSNCWSFCRGSSFGGFGNEVLCSIGIPVDRFRMAPRIARQIHDAERSEIQLLSLFRMVALKIIAGQALGAMTPSLIPLLI
jgi:hypothetical protein